VLIFFLGNLIVLLLILFWPI